MKKVHITLRLEQEIATLLDRCAQELGITRTQLIRKAILHYLNLYQNLFLHDTQKKIIEVLLKYA